MPNDSLLHLFRAEVGIAITAAVLAGIILANIGTLNTLAVFPLLIFFSIQFKPNNFFYSVPVNTAVRLNVILFEINFFCAGAESDAGAGSNGRKGLGNLLHFLV